MKIEEVNKQIENINQNLSGINTLKRIFEKEYLWFENCLETVYKVPFYLNI